MHLGDIYGGSGTAGGRALAALAALANLQHGVVAVAQLISLGYSMRTIERWVQSGRLHRLYRGVYAVGHTRLSLRGRWLAAVLACGPEAVLSHHAAAALWELRPNPAVMIDVTAPVKRTHAGIRSHVTRSLPALDRTTIDAIPVTTVERTVLDYAEIARPRQVVAALEAAQRCGRFDVGRFEQLLARSPGRRGVKPLKAAIGELHDEAPWTQSELERRFLQLVRSAGLPEPQTNVLVAGHVVDMFWPQQRLVVEIDSYGFHQSRVAFEADRRKDAELQLAGYRVVRITYRQMVRHPEQLVRELRGLLSGSGGL